MGYRQFESKNGRGQTLVWSTNHRTPCIVCLVRQELGPTESCNLEHRCPAWAYHKGDTSKGREI